MKKTTVKLRGKTLCKADVLASLLGQAKGLMFAVRAKPLLFVFKSEKRRCIHSNFCPVFDAVFLNAQKKVVFYTSCIEQGRVICSVCKFILECPPGTVKKFNLKKGDKLKW